MHVFRETLKLLYILLIFFILNLQAGQLSVTRNTLFDRMPHCHDLFINISLSGNKVVEIFQSTFSTHLLCSNCCTCSKILQTMSYKYSTGCLFYCFFFFKGITIEDAN